MIEEVNAAFRVEPDPPFLPTLLEGRVEDVLKRAPLGTL